MDFLFGSNKTTTISSHGKKGINGTTMLKLYYDIVNRFDSPIDFEVGDYIRIKSCFTDSSDSRIRISNKLSEANEDLRALVLEMKNKDKIKNLNLGSASDITIAIKDPNSEVIIKVLDSDSRLFCKYDQSQDDAVVPLTLHNFKLDSPLTNAVPGNYVRMRKGLHPNISSDMWVSSTSFSGHTSRNVLEYFIILRIDDHSITDIETQKVTTSQKVVVGVIDKDSHKIIETSFPSYMLAEYV